MIISLITRIRRQAQSAPAPRRRTEPQPRIRWYR